MDISGIVLVMDTKELAILLELFKDCKEFLVGDSSYQWVVAGICLRYHNSSEQNMWSNKNTESRGTFSSMQ